jgi:hypothetical protein
MVGPCIRQRSAARGLRPRRGRPCRARGVAMQRPPTAGVRGGRCGARSRARPASALAARPRLGDGRCGRHCSALSRRRRRAAAAFSRVPVRLAPALSRGPAALARRVAQRRSCRAAAADGARRAVRRRRARVHCLTRQGVGLCRGGLAGSGAAPRGRPLGWRRRVPERQAPQRRAERSRRPERGAGAAPAAGRGWRRALAGARPRGQRRRRRRRLGARQASSPQLRRGGAPGLGQAEARAVQQAARSRARQHPHARALQQAGQRRPGRQRRQRLARSALSVGQAQPAPDSAPHAGSVWMKMPHARRASSGVGSVCGRRRRFRCSRGRSSMPPHNAALDHRLDVPNGGSRNFQSKGRPIEGKPRVTFPGSCRLCRLAYRSFFLYRPQAKDLAPCTLQRPARALCTGHRG